MFEKIRKFFVEVYLELKKVSWSTRKELIESTWIVLISSGILGLFIGIIDLVLSQLIRLVIG